MPELPEVEFMTRTFARRLTGATIVAVEEDGRGVAQDEGEPLARLEGASVDRVERRGKVTWVALGGTCAGRTLRVRYGMTGRWVDGPGRHVRLVLTANTGVQAGFEDPRRFGSVCLVDAGAARAEQDAVGPEPWPAPLSAASWSARFAGTRRAVKPLLLEPARVAGLGNIAASEILFRAQIAPTTSASVIPEDGWARIARATVAYVDETLAHAQAAGDVPWLQDGHAPADSGMRVYGREGAPCLTCGTPIRRMVQSARSTFWCPRCQPA